MGFYDEKILPHAIDLACGSKPNMKQREKIVPLASGDVLEIGFGSGLNLPFYRADRIGQFFALEPSDGMRRKAASRVAASPIDVKFIALPGEQIPLPDESVDTVLVTYSLCTIPDAVTALEGMRRVLRPGGHLIFCEHGIAPDNGVRRWQRRINPAWRRVAGGCNMDRDIPELIRRGGFELENIERKYIPGLKILSYNVWGTATPRR